MFLKVGIVTFRALVVDDDQLTLDLMEVVLKPIGGEVVRAMNVEDAFQVLQEYVPDVVFLDMIFPRIQGMDLLNFVVENAYLESMLVVVITAHDFVEACKQLGRVNAYLLKPTSARDIRRVTQTLLEKRAVDANQGPIEMLLVTP